MTGQGRSVLAHKHGLMLVLLLTLAQASGCGGFGPSKTADIESFALDGDNAPASLSAVTALTLSINPPRAAAGFDSSRIVYVRTPHEIQYFAQSVWVDRPAIMLAPLLVAAIARDGVFRSVVTSASAARNDLQLDSEIVRLQHEFYAQPSRAHFTLRVSVLAGASRAVLASREFDSVVESPSEDARGGVTAANEALNQVLGELARWCGVVARDYLSTASR